MAAVEVLSFSEGRLKSDCWMIEEDTRIRLNLIARAWVESRKAQRNKRSSPIKLIIYPQVKKTLQSHPISTPLKIPNPHPPVRIPELSVTYAVSLHDYIEGDTYARPRVHDSIDLPSKSPPQNKQSRGDKSILDPTMAPRIDFQSEDGFQQAGANNKKGKRAAKQAEKAKFGEDDGDDGNKKEEGETNRDDQNGGSGDAGDGGKGNGGGNGDGGDANAEDEWDIATTKPKKKGKKGKFELEPEPASNNMYNDNEGNGEFAMAETGDDFGGILSSKLKKKAKKGKYSPESEPNLELEPANQDAEGTGFAGETKADDDWPTPKKKGKKGKYEPESELNPEPEPANQDARGTGFADETKADDNWLVPTKSKKKGKKGKYDPDPDPDQEPEPSNQDAEGTDETKVDDFLSSTKSKKKGKKGKYEPEPEPDQEPEPSNQDAEGTGFADETKADDTWLTPTKSKKKGKKGKYELEPEPDQEPEPSNQDTEGTGFADETKADNPWSIPTKSKKKGKKGKYDPELEPDQEPEPFNQDAEGTGFADEIKMDDSLSSTKLKKKGKKGKYEPDPEPDQEPEPSNQDAVGSGFADETKVDDTWLMPTKSKKKGKKGKYEPEPEPDQEPEPSNQDAEGTGFADETKADNPWSIPTKSKKKGKKGKYDPEPEPDQEPEPSNQDAEGTGFADETKVDDLSTKLKKKGKKGKYEPEPEPDQEPEPSNQDAVGSGFADETKADGTWSVPTKSKKKGKKGKYDPEPEPYQEPEPSNQDAEGTWFAGETKVDEYLSTKSKKKGKKGKYDLDPELDLELEPANQDAEGTGFDGETKVDDYLSSTNPKKNGKKGKYEAEAELDLALEPANQEAKGTGFTDETTAGDSWSMPTKSKKKGKKGKNEAEAEPNIEPEPANRDAEDAGAAGEVKVDDDWMTSAKSKKKGKKGKLEPELEPELEPVKEENGNETKAEVSSGLVTGKLMMKGKEPEPEIKSWLEQGLEEPLSFHEIKLDDSPLDLDLGFSSSKATSSGGFSAWSNNWHTGTTTTMTSTTAVKPKDNDTENNSWSINRGKPKKKNATSASSFGIMDEPNAPAEESRKSKDIKKSDLDFDLTFGQKEKRESLFSETEAKEQELNPIIEEHPIKAEVSEWGGWGIGSKLKKSKETSEDSEPAKVETKEESKSIANDEFFFGTKKDKKKKSKGMVEEALKVEDPTPALEIETETVPVETIEDDAKIWGSWESTTKKEKKKKGKASTEEAAQAEGSTTIPDIGLESVSVAGDSGYWDRDFISKKEKKKKGKVVTEVSKVEDPDVKPEYVPEPVGSYFDSWAATKDKKKKATDPTPFAETVIPPKERDTGISTHWGLTKFKITGKYKEESGEESKEETLHILTSSTALDKVFEPAADETWLNWADDKEKETTSKALVEIKPEEPLPPPPPIVPEVGDPLNDDIFKWGLTKKKDKKKKGKVSAFASPEASIQFDEAIKPDIVEEPNPDIWDTPNLKNDKKAKSKNNLFGVVDETFVEPVVDPVGIEETKLVEDNMISWGSVTRTKKGKGKKVVEPPPPAPTPPVMDLTEPEPEPEPEPELEPENIWPFGTWKKPMDKSKDKKSEILPTTTKFFGIDKVKTDKETIKEVAAEKEKVDTGVKSNEAEEAIVKGAKSAPKLNKRERKTAKEKAEKDAATAREATEAEARELAEAEVEAKAKEEEEATARRNAEEESAAKAAKSVSKLTKREQEKAERKAVKEREKAEKEAATLREAKVLTSQDAEIVKVTDEASAKPEKEPKFTRVESRNFDFGLDDPALALLEPKAANAFSFWGAKKATSAATGAIQKGAPSATDEIATADKSKLPEDASKDATTYLKPTPMRPSSITKKPVGGKVAEKLKAFERVKEVATPPPPPPTRPPPPPTRPSPPQDDYKRPSVTVNFKGSSRERAGEAVEEDPLFKTKSRTNEVPGSFPTDTGEIVDIVDTGVEKENSSKKFKKADNGKDAPIEAPLPTVPLPVQPSAPPTPAPEPKKERPRVVRDPGSSWGMWNAAPRKDEKEKKSKDRKQVDAPAIEKKSKDRKQADAPSAERRSKDDAVEVKRSKSTKKSSEKTSSKDSSSDKTEKAKKSPKPKVLSSIFGPPPPLSRSASTRDKRSSTRPRSSSRRRSIDVAGINLTSPEDATNPPEMSAKAAKMLGVAPMPLSRSKSEQNGGSHDASEGLYGEVPSPGNETYPGLEEDIVFVDDEYSSPERPTRKSKSKVKQDDDIVMVDGGGPSEDRETSSKRRGYSVKKAAGLSSMWGGFLSKSRPEPKRRSAAPADEHGRALRREDRKVKRIPRDEDGDADAEGILMTGGATEEDQEARRAARRVRRAEREAAEKAAEEARRAKEEKKRQRRREQEEAEEARRLEEREARRAARRLAEQERLAAEAREAERAERRRIRRAGREVAARRADDTSFVDEPNRTRSDRRKSAMENPLDDEERRARREERRAMRSADAQKTSRRKSAPVEGYLSSRNASQARETEHRVYNDARRNKASWPHSGTDSWVKEHSDAPPPPEDRALTDGDEVLAPETEAELRKSRRSSRYDGHAVEDQEERRRRRDSRRAERETLRNVDGGQGERRYSRRDSGLVDQMFSRTSTSQGRGSWWKKLAGN